jgi:hypothetical protein
LTTENNFHVAFPVRRIFTRVPFHELRVSEHIGDHRRWRATKNPRNLLGQAKSLNSTPVGLITAPMIKEALTPTWEEHPYQVVRAAIDFSGRLSHSA